MTPPMIRATRSPFPATDPMLKRLFAGALFAGLAAGLVATALQVSSMVPIILEAELYETGARVHFGETDIGETAGDEALYDFVNRRNILTFGMNLVTYVGWGLLMVVGFAIAERAGHRTGWRTGLLWGAAGFAAVAVAPGAGLPPELPGAAAADLGARQLWWIGTVIATAAGTALIAFGGRPAHVVAALVLILLPHLIGAPQPLEYAGVVPPEMAGHFAARSIAVNAAVWLVLGALAGLIWSRSAEPA